MTELLRFRRYKKRKQAKIIPKGELRENQELMEEYRKEQAAEVEAMKEVRLRFAFAPPSLRSTLIPARLNEPPMRSADAPRLKPRRSKKTTKTVRALLLDNLTQWCCW